MGIKAGGLGVMWFVCGVFWQPRMLAEGVSKQGAETIWDLGPARTCPFEGALESPPEGLRDGGVAPGVLE